MERIRRICFLLVLGVLFAIFLGGLISEFAPRYHAYVVFQATDSLKVFFLQRPEPSSVQCNEIARRIVSTMLAHCETCRLRKSQCLTQLNSRQRKLLNGQPLDVPLVRTSTGVITFVASDPALGVEACRETERHASRALPGSICYTPEMNALVPLIGKISVDSRAEPVPRVHALLGVTFLAAAISFLFCWLIIRSERLHRRFSHDPVASGSHKVHATPTPRIGGIAIAISLATSTIALAGPSKLSILVLCAIPAFFVGLLEDITKQVGVFVRLMMTVLSGALGSLLLGATLDRVDVPGFDALLLFPLFAVAFTAFAVAGITNALNIVDGYNGLAGGYVIMVLAALVWVAAHVGDSLVLSGGLVMAGAVLGFLVWNYPGGKIFLGDGGAYLIGFWLAELSVLLVLRNPGVSSWFPLLLLAYPFVEVMFSIYRRAFVAGESPGRADAGHLHHLLFRHLTGRAQKYDEPGRLAYRRNFVAPLIWAGSAVFIVPSLLVWHSTPSMLMFVLAFFIGYLWLYLRLGGGRLAAGPLCQHE